MRTEFLPFNRPLLGAEEEQEVVEVLRSGWLAVGPRVKRFEDEFAAFIGAPTALALSSGTAALHLALVALGVGSGHQVVTSTMTFCSAVHVIEHVGARPLLVDVEPDTLNLDPSRTADVVRNGAMVRAIMPAHLHGHPADMAAIGAIARQHEVAVIEDAAHALPAAYRGRTVGASSTESAPVVLTAFSFYATKNLTTGDGGMLTGPLGIVDDARIWSLHGMSRDAWKRYNQDGSWYYEVIRPGFKYNMTELEAAIGLQQLRRLPVMQARRREIARRYNTAFSAMDTLQCPATRPDVDHAWHLYGLRLRPERFRWWTPGDPSAVRAQFIRELAVRHIGASVHFIPVHLQPYYRDRYGYRPDDFPVAAREYARLVSLPLYPGMSDGDVDDVIEAVADVIAKHRR
jgi:dTDP-4-amino-4,6-dideoxygalactose transaminase